MSVSSSLMYSFMQRLKASRSSLSRWHNSISIGDILNMHYIQQQLEDLYSKLFDTQNAVLGSSLLFILHNLQQQDEILSFFYLITLQK